jgi:hypothetical protein
MTILACCIEDKELFLSVIRKMPAAGRGSLINVLPKLFSSHDGRQRCRESMKLDKCSLGNDPDTRKSGRNLLEVLESEDF